MKKVIALAFLATFLIGGENMLVEGKSALDVKQTSEKLQNILKSKGLDIFSVIKHSDEAKKVNLDMQDTQVVIFGSPKAGTPLMQCSPKIALELPLKMLIYKNKKNETIVAYEDIKNAATRYDTKNCEEIILKLSKAQENFFKAITK